MSQIVRNRPPAKRFLGPWGAAFLAFYLVLTGVGLVVGLYQEWPAATANGGAQEQVLLLVALMAGALGSWLHAAASFVAFVGNRNFITSWVWWYLIRPMLGGGLALAFYFVIRAGLLTANAGSESVSAYGVAAFSALVGLSTERATAKLQEVFNALFKSDQKSKDPLPTDEERPVPEITEVLPPSLPAGSGGTEGAEVEIQGQGFEVGETTVLVNGKERAVTVDGAGSLRVALLAEDLAQAGELSLVVKNPEPGGGEATATVTVTAST